MQCPACQHENPSGSAFCAGCGASQTRVCPGCAFANPPTHQFCNRCGGRLDGAPRDRDRRDRGPSAPETPTGTDAQRRQLTVMFCDLLDSTELASRAGAETWREVVQRFQRACTAVIERYDGLVAQYLGDGLLVYFGYPQAHEDDVERGVRAALELLASVEELNPHLASDFGIELHARIGIHTGAVVVGDMGGGDKRQPLAVGDAANTAARLQGVARAGTVVVTDTTLQLVRGLFISQDLGETRLKGIPDVVRVHRIIEPAEGSNRYDAARRLTPLVGRQQELGLLLGRWEHALDGNGQVIVISGEAGIGKSRLAESLRESLDGSHTWLECRPSAFTSTSAFHPVIELVRQGLELTPSDSPEQRLQKLETGLGRAGFDLRRAVPLFGLLLAIPIGERYEPLAESREVLRNHTLDALVRWVLTLADQEPVAILLEDLHWCDPSTLELLGLLIEQSATSRVLILLTHRPEFHLPWEARSHVTPLTLSNLSKRQARELAKNAAEPKTLAEPLLDRIVERADGVPLFLEELVRVSLERDDTAPDAVVPATLRDSLMAHLDVLGPARELAQVAAALGRTFSWDLLRAVTGWQDAELEAPLDALVEAEILRSRGVPPSAVYTFKHALIQETAYQSLLKRQRRRIHGRVAEALEKQFPAQIEAEPEILAQQLAAAGDATRAAAAFERAGVQAAQRAAHAEAVAHFRRGLEELRKLPDSPERTRIELALEVHTGASTSSIRGYAAAELLGIWERALLLANSIADREEAAAALIGLSTYYSYLGDAGKAEARAGEILELADQADSRVARMGGHAMMSQAHLYVGRYEASLEHARTCLALYDPGTHAPLRRRFGTDLGVAAHGFASFSDFALGFPDRAIEQARSGVELAERVDHALSLGAARLFEIFALFDSRRIEAAAAAADLLVEYAHQLRFPFFEGFAQCMQAICRTLLGKKESWLDDARSGLELIASTGVKGGTTHVLCLLAEANRSVGRYDEALEAIDSAERIARETGHVWWSSELLRNRAEVLLARAPDDREAALGLLRDALDHAHGLHARSLELRAAMSLARATAQDGRPDEGRALLAPLYAWFTEGFHTRDLQDAKALLQELGA